MVTTSPVRAHLVLLVSNTAHGNHQQRRENKVLKCPNLLLYLSVMKYRLTKIL
jgi:hypothetical protein